MDPYYLIGDDDEYEADMEELELLGELMGDDDEEDPILGQRSPLHRRISARRGGSRRIQSSRARIRKALVPKTPGVPKPGGREQPLGFTPVQFTDSSALVFNLTAEPQVPLKGRRLIIDVVREAGEGGLITIVDLKVGQRSQLISAQPLIVAGYGPTAFGVDMALDPAVPGTVVTLTVACSAQPGSAKTVDIGAMIIGLSIN